MSFTRSLMLVSALGVACSGTVETTGGSGQGGGGGADPCDCTKGEYAPVCGVDDVTYDSACGMECVPVDIACQGECPCADCDGLETQYATALAEAKSCDPAIDVPQCTQIAGGDLTCKCPTYVDATQTAAIAELDDLDAQWTAESCGGQVACDCASPSSAICQRSAGGGTCTDLP